MREKEIQISDQRNHVEFGGKIFVLTNLHTLFPLSESELENCNLVVRNFQRFVRTELFSTFEMLR